MLVGSETLGRQDARPLGVWNWIGGCTGFLEESVRSESVAVTLGASAFISDSCLKHVSCHRALLSNQILQGFPVYKSGKKSCIFNRYKSSMTFS